MQLVNRLEVPLPAGELFDLLLDVERIAPCMPGASLEERDGDRVTGTLKVKVGPISTQYRGTVEFVEIDPATRRVVLKGSGRETRGQGGAEATITATVSDAAGGGVVDLVTDLQIRGKVAQFGRGVLADVSQGLLQTFADNLRSQVLSPSPAAESPGAESAAADSAATADGRLAPPAAVPVDRMPPEVQELDALRLVALPMLRRAWPVLALIVVAAMLRRAAVGRR